MISGSGRIGQVHAEPPGKDAFVFGASTNGIEPVFFISSRRGKRYSVFRIFESGESSPVWVLTEPPPPSIR